MLCFSKPSGTVPVTRLVLALLSSLCLLFFPENEEDPQEHDNDPGDIKSEFMTKFGV